MRERSEQGGASERANGRASDPVIQSVFLVVPAHRDVVNMYGVLCTYEIPNIMRDLVVYLRIRGGRSDLRLTDATPSNKKHVTRTHACTMVENRIKHRQNSYLIIHCPTSEGVSEVSEQANE